NAFVDAGSVHVNLVKLTAPGVLAADIVSEVAVGQPTLTLNGFNGSFNGDGTGNFAFGIACATSTGAANPSACNGESTPAFSELTFTVINSTISDFTSAAVLAF